MSLGLKSLNFKARLSLILTWTNYCMKKEILSVHSGRPETYEDGIPYEEPVRCEYEGSRYPPSELFFWFNNRNRTLVFVLLENVRKWLKELEAVEEGGERGDFYKKENFDRICFLCSADIQHSERVAMFCTGKLDRFVHIDCLPHLINMVREEINSNVEELF